MTHPFVQVDRSSKIWGSDEEPLSTQAVLRNRNRKALRFTLIMEQIPLEVDKAKLRKKFGETPFSQYVGKTNRLTEKGWVCDE